MKPKVTFTKQIKLECLNWHQYYYIATCIYTVLQSDQITYTVSVQYMSMTSLYVFQQAHLSI